MFESGCRRIAIVAQAHHRKDRRTALSAVGKAVPQAEIAAFRPRRFTQDREHHASGAAMWTIRLEDRNRKEAPGRAPTAAWRHATCGAEPPRRPSDVLRLVRTATHHRAVRKVPMTIRAPAHRAPPRRRAAGGVLIETVIGIGLILSVAAGLLYIMQAGYVRDQLHRAARAGARAVALMVAPAGTEDALNAAVCDAIRRELQLPDDAHCAERWTIDIAVYEDAQALRDGRPIAGGPEWGGGRGELVVVRLAQRADGGTATGNRWLATALARNEREDAR